MVLGCCDNLISDPLERRRKVSGTSARHASQHLLTALQEAALTSVDSISQLHYLFDTVQEARRFVEATKYIINSRPTSVATSIPAQLTGKEPIQTIRIVSFS